VILPPASLGRLWRSVAAAKAGRSGCQSPAVPAALSWRVNQERVRTVPLRALASPTRLIVAPVAPLEWAESPVLVPAHRRISSDRG
jgi:hypothetical protein